MDSVLHSHAMNISVLIPSFGRGDKLRRCLIDLARQTSPPHEILVGLDGGTEPQAVALQQKFAGTLGDRLQVMPFTKCGYIPIRRRLLGMATGDLFLSLNDDVRPDPGLIAAHTAAHAKAGSPSNPAIVTGPAPWAKVAHPTLFDALVARTDLIFFQPAPGSDGRVGYRDCYGLNFSAPVRAAQAAGGFHDLPDIYGYDDIEFAFRVGRACDTPILFASDAIVTHDHRYTPLDVMRREYQLGRAAQAYRSCAPEFTAALFGRDIAERSEIEFTRAFLRRMRRDAERMERSFLGHDRIPEQDPGFTPEHLSLRVEHWVLLKRYLWRWGLFDATREIAPRFETLAQADPLP